MSDFNKKRLKVSNIAEYLDNRDCTVWSRIITGIQALKQRDYGKTNDCTLTSMTAYARYILGEGTNVDIYNKIAEIATRYGYDGEGKGILPFCTRTVFNQVLAALGGARKTHVRYLKNIGFNYDFIKTKVDNDIPLILSLYNDGRDYYKNHSILIVGYYEIELKDTKEIKKFLQVYDNWTAEISLVDYDKLSIISSVNYI